MHTWINNMTQKSNKYSTEIRKGGSVLPCDVAAWSGRLSWVRQVRGCRIGAQEGWTWSRSVGRAIRQGERAPSGRKWGMQREIAVCLVLKGVWPGLGLDPGTMGSLRGRRWHDPMCTYRRLLCLGEACGEESKEWGDDQIGGSGSMYQPGPELLVLTLQGSSWALVSNFSLFIF